MTDRPARWTVKRERGHTWLTDHGNTIWLSKAATLGYEQLADLLNAPAVSPEAQAVIDAAVKWRQGTHWADGGDLDEAVYDAVDAYLASLDPEAPTDD